jgi:tRNA A-37 threonylcarbamoyl transferase component Bud32
VSDVADRLNAALASRYLVEGEIGSGGMATVYLAEDRRYGRKVAVKVLKPDLAAAVGSARFLREIRITAQLNHPHILPLLDSGEATGFLYYVMPYVTGGSLRSRLRHGVALDLAVVARVTAQVAAALSHAHHHGIVHRDIKPENILFSEGLAIVADFGIARAVAGVSDGGLTRSGFPLGTPGYMSPEQAAGLTALEPRTDVFGLGCVVYEMLVGETPGLWPSDEGLRLGRFLDASPEHREQLDRLPGRVEQALVKALAVRPADRFDTPTDFADALAQAATAGPKLRDAEVDRLLQRAAQLDLEHPTEASGLSIGGVEQVAAQVGIPPARVREAAVELAAPAAAVPLAQPQPRRAFFPNRVVVDRVVPGQLPPSTHEALVNEIQRTLSVVGLGSTLGRSLTWTCTPGGASGRDVRIAIAPEGDGTRIHMEEHLDLRGPAKAAPALGAAMAGLIGVLAAGVLGGPDAAGIGMILGGALGIPAAIRFVLVTQEMNRRPELERLAERLAARATGNLPPGRDE